MAGWNGFGVFDRAYNWVADKLASIKIIASRMDGEFDNYKTGLQNCLTRDGQTPPTANVPFNNFKGTGIANGTVATDVAAFGQIGGLTTGNAFRKNLLVNGGFDIWQAGAGGSASIVGGATRTRTADCWWAIRQGTTGYTVSQQTGEVNRYSLKWARDAANASTQNMLLAQSIETANVVRLKRGTPPTMFVSFYAKKGANYSGGNLTIDVVRGTGTDENVLDTYTGATVLATLSQALSVSITRYSVTVPADASTNEIGVRFTWTPVGVAGADDSITLENVQLEVASAATDFDYLSFDESLRECQRYFWKSFEYQQAPAQNVGNFSSTLMWHAPKAAAVAFTFRVPNPVPMRRISSRVATFYNTTAANAFARNVTASVDATVTSLSALLGEVADYIQITPTAGSAVGDLWQVNHTVGDPTF